jgi:glycosyltransferase 2 family protein
LANNLLPARAGEFIRSAMVCASSGLTQRFVLATAACERVLDLLVFVALAEIAVTRASNVPPPLLHAIHLGFAGSVVGVAVLVAMSRSEKFIHFLLARGLRRPHMASRVQARLEPVLAGLRSIHSLNRILCFLALSVLIWMLDVWGAQLVALATGLHLSWFILFMLMTGFVFMSIIPATPGQIGIFQWIVIRTLAIWRVDYNQALAYSFILQAGGYVALTLLSIPGLLLYRRSRANRQSFCATSRSLMENLSEVVQRQP